MDLLDYSLPIFGGLLCLLAIAQLGFWAAHSWRIGTQSKQQFELNRELLRQQLQSQRQQRQQVETFVTDASEEKTKFESTTESSDAAIVRPDGSWRGFRKFRVAQLVNETSRCRSVYLVPDDEHPHRFFFGWPAPADSLEHSGAKPACGSMLLTIQWSPVRGTTDYR